MGPIDAQVCSQLKDDEGTEAAANCRRYNHEMKGQDEEIADGF